MANGSGIPFSQDHPGAADRPQRQILTVRELNEQIQSVLQRAFTDPIWVRGEIQRLAPDAARRQHVYFELHEEGRAGVAGYQVPAAIMGWDRQRFGLGRYLDGSDPAFRLQDKIEACLLCRVDFYPPFGKLSLKVVGIDPDFSLGQLELRRRQTLAWLKECGLLSLNAARPMPDMPLRVGLITSRGSAAAQDVQATLAASGYPFLITLVDCRMQGQQTSQQVIAALQGLAAMPIDVVLIARGGGSRADLSWFDQADLCEAIARCSLPVMTAIGHEIDTSLADLCSHTRCKTPTAAAGFLVERLQQGEQRLGMASHRLETAALLCLGDAHRRLDGCKQLTPLVVRRLRDERRRVHALVGALQGRTGRAVARHQQHLLVLAGRLIHGARQRVAAAGRRAEYLSWQLDRQAPRAIQGWHRRLLAVTPALGPSARRLLRARAAQLELLAATAGGCDPGRMLARGYTLTLDERGRRMRLAAAVQPGQTLVTRFIDGEIASIACNAGTTIEPVEQTARKQRSRKARQGGDHGNQEDTGQQALF